MNFGIERIYHIEPWKVTETDFSLERNKLSESIFSLSNEYMGVRGMYEEAFPADQSDKTLLGSYISGIFHKEKYNYIWIRKGFPDYGNYMSNTTNWTRMTVSVGDETFNITKSSFTNYERSLDMRTGILNRTFIFETAKGERTELYFERFLSFDDQHIGGQRIVLKAINHHTTVSVSFTLDAEVGNQHYGYDEGADVFDKVIDDQEQFLLMNIKSTGQYYIHRMTINAHAIDNAKRTYSQTERSVTCHISFETKEGLTYTIDKLVSVWTSRDAGFPYGLIEKDTSNRSVDQGTEDKIINLITENSKETLRPHMKENSYDSLQQQHISIMADIWDKVDIEIQGDPLSQQGIRYCIFQLLGTYRGVDSYANIGAKGLTGEHYMGRYFWDTESYCMPAYLFINPDAAKNLVEYRYNTLGEAKKNAAKFDYRGAMYPWQTIDGSEDCIFWEYAYFEIHINAIIPYAIQLYTNITNDVSFLHEKGIAVLLEQSKYWSDRVSWMPERAAFGILRVTGPDEYQQLTNNNYYTNYMAKETLDYTMSVIDSMKENAPVLLKQAVQNAEFDMDELKRWKKISEKMYLNTNEAYDIFPQDDMFTTLEPKFKEDLDRENDIPAEAKWTIDRFTRYDLVKQPDVLLMMFLYRNRFTLEEKKQNYKFYEQRTVHGSSLSPSIHSIMASEIGRHNQAYEYYLWASRLDLDNYNTNSDKGLHISAMSGTWMNIVFGFGGMNINGDCLEFNPSLPNKWNAYSFKIIYRNSIIKISVDPTKASVEVIDGDDVEAIVYGSKVTISTIPTVVATPDSITDRPEFKAVIFDLDGVIVDTAKYHYKAWKSIADEEGIYFDEQINERLKGVSRVRSLEIIMERKNKHYSDEAFDALAAKKNDRYLEMLEDVTPADILPGINTFISELKSKEIKLVVYSASKNATIILDKLGILSLFDSVVTGNDITHSKPHVEGYMVSSDRLGIKPESCVMVEDSFAGIEGAIKANMKSVGIGEKLVLHNADYVLRTTEHLTYDRLNILF